MSGLTYLHLPAGKPLPSQQFQPFKAMVVIEQAVTGEWRNLVSDWLVQSGCLYMLAWGNDCSLWDDSVDWANIAMFGENEIPDDKFVMTTWHDNQPLSDALWFASHCATHPLVDLDHTLIVHISAAPREAELLSAYRNAE